MTITEGSPSDINSWAFTPGDVTVSVGQSITWTNNGTQAHTATADNGSAFDTGLISPGESKTITFSTPGTLTYHCTPHPWMKATIIVSPASPAAAQPAAAQPAPAAPAVSQAQPTPTPFRLLTPTPVAARPATTVGATPPTSSTPAPKAGGLPDGLPVVLVAAGACALLAGVQVLRRGRLRV